jgi:hypothetical protein
MPAPCSPCAHPYCSRCGDAARQANPARAAAQPAPRRAGGLPVEHLEALGGAAPSSALPTAVLAQYHCGLCAVLAWLAGDPALPPRFAPPAPEAALFADRRSVLSPASEVSARARGPLRALPAPSARLTAARPAAAPGRRAAAVRRGARRGAARRVPEGLLQRARGRPAHPRRGAGAVRGLRCAPTRPGSALVGAGSLDGRERVRPCAQATPPPTSASAA